MANDLRQSLLLGQSLTVQQGGQASEIKISCQAERGFSPGLTHKPVILPYRQGILLQLWRGATELILGIFCSALLLLSLASRSNTPVVGTTNFKPRWPHFLLGFSALLYSISLAHYPRLFLEGLSASALHAILRTLFGFSFYLLCGYYSRIRQPVLFLHIALAAFYFFSALKWPSYFELLYDRALPVFAILTTVAVYDLHRSPLKSRSAIILRFTSAAWLLAQVMDISVTLFNSGAYMAPSVVALVAVLIALLKRSEDFRSAHTEDAARIILRLIAGPGAIDDKLRAIGSLMSEHTHFSRISVYADAFVFGLHDIPKERFVRLMDAGYRKETSKDRVIDFNDGRGALMRDALASLTPRLRQGSHDSAWFTNIPLGNHAILNLSDDSTQPDFLASESHELILRVLPALQTIGDKLAEYGTKLTYALEGLRLVRGDGTWNEEIGAIFLDLNYYADNMERYRDPYGKFITTIYLPALCQRVRKWAVREGNSAGDAVYLICIRDLMHEPLPVSDAVYRTLVEILRFTVEEGAAMCRAQGYEVISLQIGANIGLANIICDQFQARTSGNIVNEASRLQKAAGVGQTFVSAEVVKGWPAEGPLAFEEARNDLVKTKKLNGRTVFLRRSISRDVA